jgi:hypothetical protein
VTRADAVNAVGGGWQFFMILTGERCDLPDLPRTAVFVAMISLAC